jgi:hypothetical protein
MTRSFDDHVDLYAAFAQRVSALSPAAWERLAAKCAALDGASFQALLGRARVFAHPFASPLRQENQNEFGKAIATVAGAGIAGLGLAFELARELGEVVTKGPNEPLTRKQPTGTAQRDRYVDANFLLENALAMHERAHPGLATTVRAAGQAVLRHDWMSPADFASAYAVMETEIPFAELLPKRALPRESDSTF